GERNSFGIVTVDVKDGCVNDLCDIGAVDTRPRIVIVGGKTHLVVDHEVNGTAGRKSGQPRHLHYLIDYTLTSHGGIAVNEDSHSFAQVSVVFIIDLATRIPQHQRVHRLQVGRIGCKLYIDLLVGGCIEVAGITQVVFNITVPHGQVGGHVPFKFRKDLFVGLAQNIRQHVKSSAVGHSDNDFLDIKLRRLVDHCLQVGYRIVAALQGESLLSQEFRVKKMLKPDGFVEF